VWKLLQLKFCLKRWVTCYSGLPDAAFAWSNSDDVFDARNDWSTSSMSVWWMRMMTCGSRTNSEINRSKQDSCRKQHQRKSYLDHHREQRDKRMWRDGIPLDRCWQAVGISQRSCVWSLREDDLQLCSSYASVSEYTCCESMLMRCCFVLFLFFFFVFLKKKAFALSFITSRLWWENYQTLLVTIWVTYQHGRGVQSSVFEHDLLLHNNTSNY